jgi:hypothetical protein
MQSNRGIDSDFSSGSQQFEGDVELAEGLPNKSEDAGFEVAFDQTRPQAANFV